MAGEFHLGRLFLDSVRVYFGRLPVFLIILLIPALMAALLFVAGAILLLGFSSTASDVDPSALSVTISRQQWVALAAEGFVMAIVMALSMGATVHAAGGAERIGVRRAFGMNTAKSLQIFWLQTVVYAIAMRFSPLAAPLLWFLVAFGTAVALREDLGPSDAMDRAWALTEKNRLRVLALEVLGLAPLLGAVTMVAYLFLIPGPWFNLNRIDPYIRLAISPLIMGFLMIPVQFMWVAFSRGYEMLKQAERPVLHAKAASSVSSS